MRRSRACLLALCATVLAALLAPAGTASADPTAPRHPARQIAGPAPRHTAHHATAVGSGGAVASVDPEATHAGLAVLRHGGNAVDAAVATAAALGVTEPFSSGIGGGGYLVYYDATKRKVFTLDGREKAPKAMTPTSFQENGAPIDFNAAVTSGLSVGVPGTLATWQRALDR